VRVGVARVVVILQVVIIYEVVPQEYVPQEEDHRRLSYRIFYWRVYAFRKVMAVPKARRTAVRDPDCDRFFHCFREFFPRSAGRLQVMISPYAMDSPIIFSC
jgi:hypothetical protein